MEIRPSFELEPGERLSKRAPRREADILWFLVRSIGYLDKWRSDDGRCEVLQRPGRRTYVARVDGELLTQTFNGAGGMGQVEKRTFMSLSLAMITARANMKDLTP